MSIKPEHVLVGAAVIGAAAFVYIRYGGGAAPRPSTRVPFGKPKPLNRAADIIVRDHRMGATP
jgi:hypothetical protein